MTIFGEDVNPAIFNPATLRGSIFYAAVIALAAWAIGHVLRIYIERYLDSLEAKGGDTTSIRFIAAFGRIGICIIAIAIYGYIVPWLGKFDTAWLSSVGILSVVIGLAAQSTLGNVISGISLILYRPFRSGDRILVTTPAGPEIGKVERINLGYTTVRTPDGRQIVLPNALMASQTSINFTRELPRILLEISITIPQSANINRSREILLAAAKQASAISHINGAFVTELTKEGAVVMLSVMCVDPGDKTLIRSEVLEKAKIELDREGIVVA